jgi:hypothetical protein
MVGTILVAWFVGSTVMGLALGAIGHRSKALYRY